LGQRERERERVRERERGSGGRELSDEVKGKHMEVAAN
jgi:hypothetical protein